MLLHRFCFTVTDTDNHKRGGPDRARKSTGRHKLSAYIFRLRADKHNDT